MRLLPFSAWFHYYIAQGIWCITFVGHVRWWYSRYLFGADIVNKDSKIPNLGDWLCTVKDVSVKRKSCSQLATIGWEQDWMTAAFLLNRLVRMIIKYAFVAFEGWVVEGWRQSRSASVNHVECSSLERSWQSTSCEVVVESCRYIRVDDFCFLRYIFAACSPNHIPRKEQVMVFDEPLLIRGCRMSCSRSCMRRVPQWLARYNFQCLYKTFAGSRKFSSQGFPFRIKLVVWLWSRYVRLAIL